MRTSLKTQEQDGALVCHPVQTLIEGHILTIRSYAAKRFDSADGRDEFIQDWCVQVLQDCPGTCSRQRFRSVSRSAIARVWESRSAVRTELPELPDDVIGDSRREYMDVMQVRRSSFERLAELQDYNEARTTRIARAWEHALNSLPVMPDPSWEDWFHVSAVPSDHVQSCFWKISVLPTGSAWHTRDRVLPESETCPIRDSRKTRPSANTLEPSTEYQCYVTWLRLFAR